MTAFSCMICNSLNGSSLKNEVPRLQPSTFEVRAVRLVRDDCHHPAHSHSCCEPGREGDLA